MERVFNCTTLDSNDQECGEEVLVPLEQGDYTTGTSPFMLYGHAYCSVCSRELWVETER